MKKKLLCIISVATLIFSGCASKKNQNKDDDAIVINKTVVAKVGDYEVTQSEFEFYLSSIKQQMLGTELSSEEDWQTAEIDGKKAIEVAKNRALESALYNVAYIEIFEKSEKELSDEDLATIKTQKEHMVAQYNAQSEDGYKNFLKQYKISDEIVDIMYKSMYCSEILYDEYSADNTVSDEDITDFYNDFYNDYFAQDKGKRNAKHILILTKDMNTQEAYPEDKKATAKKLADEVYQKALAGEDFDSLISQYNEDPGMQSSPDGYIFGDGEMVTEFESCVDSLKYNEIGFVESSFGYHIVKKLELGPNSYKTQITSAILMQGFNDYIDQKISEYGITIEETPEMQNVKLIADKDEENTTPENTEVKEDTANQELKEETTQK